MLELFRAANGLFGPPALAARQPEAAGPAPTPSPTGQCPSVGSGRALVDAPAIRGRMLSRVSAGLRMPELFWAANGLFGPPALAARPPIRRRRFVLGINHKIRLLLLLLLAGGVGLAALLIHPWGPYLSALALFVAILVGIEALRSAEPRVGVPSSDELERLSSSFDTTLRISDETLAYMRQGLNEESAQKITEIMKSITEVDAVAITDNEKILGFSGVGCRRHRQGGPILTGATKEVLHTGQPKVVMDPRMLACDEPGCPHPLKSSVIAPLKYRDQVVGTFKLYRTSAKPLPPHVARLAVGIAQLLSLQMELAEADRQRQLATKARLEALQAQIRPHFLFNVLNTIIHFSRTDVERAREMLVQLASFFRRSLSYRGNFITLQEEIEYINTYLSLEKARFGDKLALQMKLDPKALSVPIPILTIQPLVENSVVHGIAPKEEGGKVGVRVRRVQNEIHVLVLDTGVGMDRETLRKVFYDGFGTGMGLGLSNVNDRLISLYGPEYALRVRSIPGRGTAIRIRIPLTGAGALTTPEAEGEIQTRAAGM